MLILVFVIDSTSMMMLLLVTDSTSI